VFDDNTTTIGYRTDSVDKLLKKYCTGPEVVPLETDDSTVASDSLVVFASLSDDAELVQAAAPLRFQGFIAMCILCSLQILGGVLVVADIAQNPEGSALFEASTVGYLSSLFLVSVSVLFLGSVRWKSSDGFVVCSAFLIAHLVFQLAQSGIWLGSALTVSTNIGSLLTEGFMIYLSNSLRDVYSAEALMVRRRSS